MKNFHLAAAAQQWQYSRQSYAAVHTSTGSVSMVNIASGFDKSSSINNFIVSLEKSDRTNEKALAQTYSNS